MVKFPLVATLVLCTCSSILAAPLPRIIAPQALSSSLGHWEFRPPTSTVESRQDIELALQSWADPHFYSYVRGRFDPERPYIQVVFPSGEEEDDDVTRTQSKPKFHEIEKIVNPIKSLDVSNDTNTTVGNTTKPSPRLFAEEQENGAGPLPYGAYELAYVVHRRRGTAYSAQRYPLVQYADYQLLGPMTGWSAWGDQVPGPLYEPVYIYRPVYPSRYHDYDVLYYVPASHEDGVAGKADNNEFEKEASEIAMPDAEHDVTVQIAMSEAEQEVTVQKDPADDPSEDGAVAEEGVVTQEEDNLEQALVKEESEQQSNDIPVEGPVEGLVTDQSEEVKETAAAEEESDSPTIDWEKELESISDEDLLVAVEGVLQRLHNRLTD